MAFVKRKDIILHYRWLDMGHDQHIVLINSLGTTLELWSELASKLTGHFNVLMFDKRGHGLSSTAAGKAHIDDYADDLIFLMDHLGVAKSHVVGLSIGGLIAFSLASRYPQRLERIVFSNTGARIGSPEKWEQRISAIREKGLSSLARSLAERWFSPRYRKSQPDQIAGFGIMLERNSDLGYTQACAAIRDADYREVLGKLPHPALFIGGTEDVSTPPDLVSENALAYGAGLEILPGVGHLPCVEVPEKLARLIIDFFAATRNISLYQRGMEIRRAVLGDAHVDRAEANKSQLDEDFQTYIVNSAWGSIWARPQLTRRERSLLTISLLAALGHDEELEMHIRATENTGATEEDVREVLLHTGVYAGVPAANGALKIAKRVFNKRKE